MVTWSGLKVDIGHVSAAGHRQLVEVEAVLFQEVLGRLCK